MVRRKYAKLYCWLRLSYANPSSQHCPFWHWTEPAYRSYHRGQRNRNQDQHASSLGLCRSHGPFSRWHQLSCRSHSGQASKRGGCPLEPDIYDTLVAGVSPENRFMNLLNSDRFSLVKRWEGDINPAILHRTRRDRLYTDCWSRSEAEKVQHSCRAHP